MADPEGFDEFYVASRGSLLRQLTAMTADPELAADVLQEAYARAWQRWSRVAVLDQPAAWVRRVAWHLAVSHFRRSAIAARLRLLGESGSGITEVDDVLDVQAALRLLPAEHRRALVLHELCGLSVAEVAAETGVAQGTVKSRLSRGRAKLGVLLGPVYADFGTEGSR
jgi:RNA polymerase sigma-70 factor (ECF subfamily)